MLNLNELIAIAGQLLLAVVLGACIGLEREIAKKSAGIRTYSLVSLGAALFIIIPQLAFDKLTLISYDPSRILSQIIVGIGFLGAGVIIFQKSHISGITTAASLWVVAAIGACVGYGLYDIAIVTSLLVIIILTLFWKLENKLLHKEFIQDNNESQ